MRYFSNSTSFFIRTKTFTTNYYLFLFVFNYMYYLTDSSRSVTNVANNLFLFLVLNIE